MANGDLHKLGTLYLGNTKRNRPTNPINGGDIPVFSSGQTIEIRDTETANVDKLHWREINDEGKRYLVSDRVLIHSINWDDLDAQSLIFGKTISIDGRQYKVRSLTGGAERREGGAGGSNGGAKLPNEWDRWIVNEGGLPGLPVPTTSDLDETTNEVDLNSVHNQYWNWYEMFSIAQEFYLYGGSSRSMRGSRSARFLAFYSRTNRSQSIGWRPVLEVLWSPPNLSPKINGQYRDYDDGWVKIDGVWREIDEIHTKINGVWRKSE